MLVAAKTHNCSPSIAENPERQGKFRFLWRKYATAFIVLLGINYIPIDTFSGFSTFKIVLILSAVVALALHFRLSKAFLFGTIYFLWQCIVAAFHPESMRYSTFLFSGGLVFSYICMYNLIYEERIFSIDYFLKIVRGMMMAFFIVCVIQQMFILVGIRFFPPINLCTVFNRGIGCNSLSLEPSHFARFMLVFYYAYVKCNEFKRGKGPFNIKELFGKEHRGVTLRFLWMMLTMGSGTAFVCLIAFSCYFIRKNNALFMIPALILMYIALNYIEFEPLNRATSVIRAVSTFDQKHVMATDHSAAFRISPLLTSLKADFTKSETWFGYGIDYGKNNNLMVKQQATFFDDYGFIFYLLVLLLNFTCAYRFFSLATLFMFMGIGGGAGTNVIYLWELMLIMTCVRYFYENSNGLPRKQREVHILGRTAT
ncbi:MAG: hypothetical protein LBM70_08210 [Victivallales bacterium]|jgi:hypothetical protein|nr:hypothetical protein [Victivallales bacterium]